MRRTTIDPPALNHYKQLMKRPSSERPFDSEAEGRNGMKMFGNTVNQQSSDLHNDSIMSQEEGPYSQMDVGLSSK